MASPVEHPSPRPHTPRPDPALWIDMRLADEVAALAQVRGSSHSTRVALDRIDALLERRHATRPCRRCLLERLDAGMRVAGIDPVVPA